MIDKVKLTALLCFEEKGYNNVSLKELALRTGVTMQEIKGMYHSKKELYIDLFLYSRDSLFNHVEQSVSQLDQHDLEIKLYHIFKSLVNFFREHRVLFCFFVRNYLYPPASVESEIRSSIQIWQENCVLTLKNLLTEGQGKETMNEEYLTEIIHSFIAFISGNMLLFMVDQITPKEESINKIWTTYWLSRR